MFCVLNIVPDNSRFDKLHYKCIPTVKPTRCTCFSNYLLL